MHDVFRFLQAGEAAVADDQDIQSSLFGYGDISDRRQDIGLFIDVAGRIAAAVELRNDPSSMPNSAKTAVVDDAYC